MRRSVRYRAGLRKAGQNMLRSQARRLSTSIEYAAPGILGRIGQQIEIKRMVALFKEGLLPPIAALGDVVGNAGENEAGNTGHAATVGWLLHSVN